MPEAVLWFITILLFVLGLFGTVIPGLPGIFIVFLGILFYSFMTGFAQISAMAVVIFGVVTALALTANYLGSIAGSRYGGGGKRAIIGTVLGAFTGTVFGGPPGLFIGAFLGAFLGALTEGHSDDKALKVAAWSVAGVLGGVLLQFILSIVLIVSFLLTVFISGT